MELLLEEYINNNLQPGFSPYYIYLIMNDLHEVGRIVLREGSICDRYFDGHIGYSIYEEYQGHHYAYQACLLLKDKIKEIGYNEVIITCDPENIPSKKTIEKLGAQYIETKPIPTHMKKLFSKDELVKEIYRWEMNL